MANKTLLIVLLSFLLIIAQPAYAQRTTQKASKPQVFVMIIFTVIGMKALSYIRVP
jgi:hypothetical protein